MSAEANCMLWHAARIDAVTAVDANSVILTRATGTRRLRAAPGEPPTPVIQLPNLRRPSTYAPMSAIRIHQTTETYRSEVASPNLTDSFQLKNAASGSEAIWALSIAMNVMLVTVRTR